MVSSPPPARIRSGVATSPFVGRGREVGVLAECLAEVREGHGSLILISGEAGIGKTALSERFLGEARRVGVATSGGRAADVMAAPPFGIWQEALTPLRATERAGTSLSPMAALQGTQGPLGLYTAVRDALVAQAARSPIVLLLDDIHWADTASLDLLRFLAPTLGDLPVLVLATYRADELMVAHPLHTLVPVLLRDAPAVSLHLAPLTDTDVAMLLAARYPLPVSDTARLVAYLQKRAGGNPFYLGELLRTLEDTAILQPDGAGWALGDLTVAPVPTLVRHLVLGRVAQLKAPARERLPLAAVIGMDVPLAVWAVVAGDTEDALLPVIEAATRARVLDPSADGVRVRFRHALIRDAIYEMASPPRRRSWHRQIAEAVVAAPRPDPDVVAHHLRQAGDPRAALWLYRAGARAVSVAAYADGIARYTEARGLLPPAVWTAGPFPTEDENAVLAAHIRFDRGLAHAVAGTYRLALADMEEAVATLASLPAESAALGAFLDTMYVPRDRRAMVASWLVHVGRFNAAATLAAVSQADNTGGRWRYSRKVLGDTYYVTMRAASAQGKPDVAWLAYREGVAAFAEVSLTYLSVIFPIEALLTVALPYAADDPAGNEVLAATAEDLRRRTGEGAASLPDGFGRLPLLGLQGRWDEARVIAETVRAAGIGGTRSEIVVCTLAPIALAQGDTILLDALVTAGLRDGPATAPGDELFLPALTLQRVAALRAIAAGDHETARAWLRAHDRWLVWSGATLGQADGALAWAEYHRAIGDLTTATAWARRAHAHACAPHQPLACAEAHRILGELAVARREDAEADAHFAATLALADACAAPYPRARALLARAGLRLSQGRRVDALTDSEEARDLAAALGARPVLGEATALVMRLTQPGSGRRGAYPAGLSGREVAVLRLMASGCTNKEIADRLSLMPGTVATHVRHILTKTNTANRTAAAAFARQHGIV